MQSARAAWHRRDGNLRGDNRGQRNDEVVSVLLDRRDCALGNLCHDGCWLMVLQQWSCYQIGVAGDGVNRPRALKING